MTDTGGSAFAADWLSCVSIDYYQFRFNRGNPFALNTTSPKVSVIIPTHNRAAVLRETLPPVLEQDFPDFEVIVVNDRSTDETAAVLSEFGDQLLPITVDFGSPARTRNAGAAAARGEFLLFTDDDCTVPSHWIAGMMDRYQTHGADAMSGGFAPFSLATRSERYQHYRMALLFGEDAKEVRACPVINFLIPRGIFEETGGFDESFPFSLEDWEFCQRLVNSGRRIMYDPAVKVDHRYQEDWPLVERRLMETARGGPALAHRSGASVHGMMLRSTAKWIAAPLWSAWSYPPDCYITSLRVETKFYFARLGAYLQPDAHNANAAR
jgi:glycosyltransferase involved in cell wall biosynthesis